MNPAALGIITLRSLSTLFLLQGRLRDSEGLALLASSVEGGVDVDDHLRKVAEHLKAGVPIDWGDITARIEDASARLHAPDAPTEPGI